MINPKWFLATAAGLIAAVLAVYPQYNLQNLRQAEFAGAFASCDLDEMAYASYLQALIDGRPRKNDPYTGRDEAANEPQPESLFSIQFAPAYAVAVPAKVFGLSASQAMPIASFVAAFLTALAVFWLVRSLTEDDWLAFAGALIVVFGGALVVGIGAINSFYENGAAYPFFPFMRRYIPIAGFPVMFAFFALLWNGLRAESKEKRAIYSALASVCFAALVFSYFYVWTAAAAVLFALFAFTLIFRGENWRADLTFLAITGAFCVFALVPYAVLLASRDETMDKAQLLVFTRRPDVFRNVEILGYAVLAIVGVAVRLGWVKLEDRRAQFVAAFAFAPFLVFNQQVLTARSLQPFHYEFYSINYVVLAAIVLIAAVAWQQCVSRFKTFNVAALVVVAFAATVWGYIEAKETTKFWDAINVRRDEAMPVNLYLKRLADGEIARARQQTTLNLEPLQADSQPTVAAQAVLWARHQHVFAGLRDWEENRRRYYQMLYYSDLNHDWLRRALTGCQDIEACMALFGWDRFNARLSANARPLTFGEIETEVQNFARFSQNFSQTDAQSPPLSHLIVYTEAAHRLENLRRWYDLGEMQTFGKYAIYELKLKPNN